MSRRSTRVSQRQTEESSIDRHADASYRNIGTKTPRTKRAKILNLDTDFILTSPKSCLVHADISTLLNAATWELLSVEERSQCLALLPDVDKVVQDDGTNTINHHLFRDVLLQDTFRNFQDRLATGQMLPSHVKKLEQAHRDRMDGKGDKTKNEQFERCWGDKQVLDHGLLAGETTKLRLTSMIADAVIKLDDIFSYRRTFTSVDEHGGKVKLVVEKECLITHIMNAPGIGLILCIARGQEKHLQRDGTDSLTEDITTLAQLENKILTTDGRISNPPNGNAWKVFRLNRKGADLGTLWEVRDRVYRA